MKLTDKLIDKLPLPESGWEAAWDDEVPGFGARVTAGGARSFILRYRTRSGRGRMYTIGPCNGWTTGQARDRAKDIKARIRSEGYDPLGEIEAERTAPTVEQLSERFLKEHASRKRKATANGYARAIARYILPALKHRQLVEVQYADIDGLHRKITKEHGPCMANRVIATLSKMFNLAIRWQMCTTNPVKGVERNPENKRRRYLSGDEIARLTVALNQHRDQAAANVIRLCLLTGARKGEVLSAKWDQFDLGAGIWTKSSSETKQKRDHVVPISAPALQLLAALRENNKTATYLFPSRGSHLQDIKEDWTEICRVAGIVGARVHDLRHTHASILASSGVSLPLIGALLGHSQPATTARYAHLYLDAQRKATETAASIIAPNGHGAEIIKHPRAL